MISIYLLLDFFKNQGVLTHPHFRNIPYMLMPSTQSGRR